MKVGTKLILKSVSILMIILIAAFTGIILMTSKNSEKSADNQVQALAEKDAAIIKAELEVSLDDARTIAQSMQGLNNLDPKQRRIIYNNMLQSVLAANPKFLGIWTCWEPNALDHMDAQYINSTSSDKTGRFIPYWHRTDNGMALEPLADYEVPEAGNYYLLARNSGQETILEPYQYEIDGKKVLLTSVAVPIKDANGKVLGVAGIDLALTDLQNIKFDQGDYKSAYTYVLANSGIIVIHSDKTAVGMNIKDRENSNQVDALVKAVGAGKCFSYESTSVKTGKTVLRSFVPIQIGNTLTPWSAAVAVDVKEINASTQQMTWLLISILVGLLIIIVVALIIIIRNSISKYLQMITRHSGSDCPR